jgi:hypothetical protein
MDRPDEKNELMLNELMAELSPEELEPRLELQVFHDPLFAAECVNNNSHGSTRIVIVPDCTNNNQ